MKLEHAHPATTPAGSSVTPTDYGSGDPFGRPATRTGEDKRSVRSAGSHASERQAVAPCPMGRVSRAEQMVLEARQLSRQRSKLLTLLLSSANPSRTAGRDVLRPLWADEAMHRAYNFVRLVSALDRHEAGRRRTPVGDNMEIRNAAALASAYRRLDVTDDDASVRCGDLLRTIVHGLAAVFGPAAGDVMVRTRLTGLSLPGFKCRALILACSELVINSILHAFPERSQGTITVTLANAGQHRACLTVADDGIGLSRSSGSDACGVAAGLALLLDGDLAYRSSGQGGTTVEIDFSTVRWRRASTAIA